MKIRKEFLVFLSFFGMGVLFLLIDIIYGHMRFGGLWGKYFFGTPHENATSLRIMVLLISIIVGLVMAMYHYRILHGNELDELDKRAQQISHQHQRVETFLDSIMQRSFDGIALCKKLPDGKLKAVMFNDRYAEMTGLTREQLIAADDIGELRWYHENDDACDNCDLASWIRADERENYFEFTSTAIQLDGGDYYIEIAREVTDKRRMEQQFYHAQKMETVWRLAGGLAHDFNNQLAVVKGYCDLLRMQGMATGEAGECISEIYKATESAGQLTGKMLAYSRSRSERSELVSVADIISHVGRTMGRVCGENISLELDCASDCGMVKTDPVLCEQAVVNLVSNALDVMVDGGMVRLACYRRYIGDDFVGSHLGGSTGDHCVIEVCDRGNGIADDVLGQIFEPFFTTKEKGKGTGLGLSMVYSFVRQSGGHIDVQSKPGSGSEFRLYLPIVEA